MSLQSTAIHNAGRLAERGRFDEALERLAWAQLACPDDPELGLAKVRLLERRGDVEEALAHCDLATAGLQQQAPFWLTKGSLHARRGERMTALECFRRARKLAPGSSTAEHLVASVGGRGFEAPLRAEVTELFDRCADRFDEGLVSELSYRGHIALPAAIDGVAGPAATCWRALDLGCGTGLCGAGLRPNADWLGGVDLSVRSVARARRRGVYDLVWVADLVYALSTTVDEDLDLLVSADVLGYLGELGPVLSEAYRVLRPGGRLAFTVEALQGRGELSMGPSRRFAYSTRYLRRALEAQGFRVELHENEALRREAGQDVAAHLVVALKEPSHRMEHSE